MPLLSCLSRTSSHIQGNLFPWLTEELGPLTERPGRAGTCLCGQGGDRAADDLDVDRTAYGGQAIAPAVRLGTPRRALQRSNLLARFRGVCAERVAEPLARGADQADP